MSTETADEETSDLDTTHKEWKQATEGEVEETQPGDNYATEAKKKKNKNNNKKKKQKNKKWRRNNEPREEPNLDSKSHLEKSDKDNTTNTPRRHFVSLDCQASFLNLTRTEQLYLYHSAAAIHEGRLMYLYQNKPLYQRFFYFLYRLFKSERIDELMKKAHNVGFTKPEWQDFILWTATVMDGATETFPPVFASQKMVKLVACSIAAARYPSKIRDELGILLGFHERGIGVNACPCDGAPVFVELDEHNMCVQFLKERNLRPENAYFRKEFVNGEEILKIYFCSVATGIIEETINGVKVRLEKGTHTRTLAGMSAHIRKAAEYADNSDRQEMLHQFATRFETGNASDGNWAFSSFLKGIAPNVRSYFTFKSGILGMPPDMAAIVSIVNKDASEKFDQLVENADRILERLPWGKAYEKDNNKRPNVAVMDVIAFGHRIACISGQYFRSPRDDSIGLVHLYSNLNSVEWVTTDFIKKEDQELVRHHDHSAEEVLHVLHELFGHGSGKNFERIAYHTDLPWWERLLDNLILDQTEIDRRFFNFDKENTVDILTGEKVASWYEPGQDFVGIFGELASPFEECRAFAVATVLCCDEEILRMIGHEGEAGQTIKYVCWLKTIMDGLLALREYLPRIDKWISAHAWARAVLMKVVLEAGQGFVTVQQTVNSEGKNDLLISLDRTKIDSVGLPAVREFIKKLQAFKSTADVKGGTALFKEYAIGPTDIAWRRIAHDIKHPATIIVQPRIFLAPDGRVGLSTYSATPEGFILSIVDKYGIE